MHWKKLLIIACILLSSVLPSAVDAQHLPIAIAGYVLYTDGTPVSDGTNVIITDTDSGSTVTVQTGLGLGLYAGTVTGSDGDTINVSVTVGGQTGLASAIADVSLVTNWINVTISNLAPVACFTYSPSLPSIDELITFKDCSSKSGGKIVSWHWDFGDGDSYTRRDATHNYGEKGTYRVTLTVTDDEGLTAMERKYICVNESSTIRIPPFVPPDYPDDPFTVPEMYDLLRANVKSENEAVIVVIDSGNRNRTYDGISLGDVISIASSAYSTDADGYGHGIFVNYIIQYGIETYSNNVIQYSIRAFDNYGESSSDIFLECIDLAMELDPDVVTISAGVFGTPTDIYSQAVSKLRRAGIFVTVSAGNDGPSPSTINSPACSSDAIAVGSINPMKQNGVKTILDLSDDRVTSFSSRGPVVGISPKPDFTAPGESIIGPWLEGSKVGSGTSLSAPFVAACALQELTYSKPLLDVVQFIYGNELYLDVLESSLAESSYDKGGPNDYGWGIPNAEIAAQHTYIKAWYYIILFIVTVVFLAVVLTITIRSSRKQSKEKESEF